MSLALQAAQVFAASAHGEQMYGDLPYTHHLSEVEQVLRRFGVTDEALLVAAWLHDSLEDTDATQDQIRMMFGDKVLDLVYRVTNEPGKNRKERHAKTYPKIQASNEAITLKLADRIANAEASITGNDKLYQMYVKEYKSFRSKLYKYDEAHEAMWRHLDFLLGE